MGTDRFHRLLAELHPKPQPIARNAAAVSMGGCGRKSQDGLQSPAPLLESTPGKFGALGTLSLPSGTQLRGRRK